MTPQVTATGIKDGDPAVLRALVDRRGTAVLAYCERACSPSLVLEAVSDAFARFRAAVIAAERPGDLHPEVALLSATRLAAAGRSPRPPAPPVTDPTAGLGRLLASTASVEIVPELLLRRADGRLSDAEEAVLEDLLDASPVARALEERFSAAEEAYRTAPREPLPPALAEQIVRTMAESNGPIPVSRPPVFQDPTVEIDAVPGDSAPGAFSKPETSPRADAPARFARVVDSEEGSGFFPRRLRRKKKADGADDGPSFTPLDPPVEPEAEAEVEAGPTMEWQVPDESADEQLATEAGLARATEEPEDAVEHVQSASGAVEETVEIDALAGTEDVEAAAEEEPVDLADPADEPEVGTEEEPEPEEEPPPIAAEAADEDDAPEVDAATSAEDDAPEVDNAAVDEDAPAPPVAAAAAHPHAHPPRRALPGRATLLPALAVVAIAAVGAMAASGIFGGNDPSPPLDTGIVPERAQQAVPEGEAASVVDDLRAASAEARRKRLADQRAAGIVPADGAEDQPDLGTSAPDVTEPDGTGTGTSGTGDAGG